MAGTKLDYNALARAANQVKTDKAELDQVLNEFDGLIRDLVNGKYRTRQASPALNQVASEFSKNKRQMLEPLDTLAEEIEKAKAKAEQADAEDAQKFLEQFRSDS